MTTANAPLFLVEITAYDPAISGTRTLYYASGQGFTTKPSETPASTYYDARLKQPIDLSRTMFSANSTIGRSTVALGDLVLLNDDGALDGLLAYGFDGRSIVVRYSWTLNPSYPSDFSSYTVTAAGPPEFTSTEIRIPLRDRQQIVAATPFQTTLYAGSNVLPAGLEGVAGDLKGKPKPVCYGVVKNIPAPCVNTSKLIYQVNDGAISSVDAVYDRGIPLSASVVSWTARTSGFSASDINCATYGNGLYVIAGASGKLATSPDGVTWTSRTSGFGTTAIRGLTYGNGLYVAVGDSGTLTTSPDGITWTSRTSGFSTTNINAVGYGNGLFVAVGDSGTLTTSSDGVTWTARTSSFGTTIIRGVCYGNRTWVAVGATSAGASSPDGITWTQRTSISQSTGASYRAVAFGLTTFVAVGSNGIVATSIDGVTWTRRAEGGTFPAAFGTSNVLAIAYGNGLYVAGCGDGTLATSLDGVVWTVVASGFGSSSINGVAFGGSTFVIVGAGALASTSDAAATYANQTDLLDDTKAPAPGTYKYLSDASGSYFRLGSKPIGIITADVTQGATSADRTHAQLWKQTLLRVSGFGSSDYSSADITALDSANSAIAGIYIGIDEGAVTVADILDRIAQSCGAWWAPDSTGVFRVKQLTAPSGSAAVAFTANDFTRPLERITPSDDTKGVPVWKVIVRYGRYYQTLTTDLAAGVDDASRAAFAQEWRDATDADASVLTAYPTSQPLVIESLFANASDAATEATRVLTLRKVQRGLYEAAPALNSETNALDFGSITSITQSRYGMSGGVLFRVLDLRPNAGAKELTLTLWGGS